MQVSFTAELTDNQVYGLKFAYQRYYDSVTQANETLAKDTEPTVPLAFEEFMSPEIARWCQSYYEQLGRQEDEQLSQKFAALTREQKATLLSQFAVDPVLKPDK